MPPRVASALSCVLLGLLLIGCGSEPEPDVTKGRFRLYVEGSLTDTLTGPAVVRTQRNGHVGIELGRRTGPGLSLELTPPAQPNRPEDDLRLHPGRYNVVAASLLNGSPTDRPSGLIAFLSVADLQFTATHGHLSVTHVGSGRVGGTLDLEMTERGDAASGARTVRVTGVLRATRP